MELKFKAGRLAEYHGNGISVKDGDTVEVPIATGQKLLDDFPDMFSAVSEAKPAKVTKPKKSKGKK